MAKKVYIGNAQGFWGDRPGAAARLAEQQPGLDYLTMDYLAEVSLTILAGQRENNPSLGYVFDFIKEMEALVPLWNNGLKVVVNAGGLNPRGCAEALREMLRRSGCFDKTIGIVSGDDVLPILKTEGAVANNLDTGEPIESVRSSLVSANAYLGAKPIAEALSQGADVVITGRVADPSLTVACCAAHHKWKWDDYDRLAGGTIAGHLIECGTQVTGGISSNWLCVPDPVNMGFPVIEMEEDGSFVVTKPKETGGVVNEETVKEQLLYELGDPSAYLSPDVCTSFLSLEVQEEEKDRVRITGAKGAPPPSTLKAAAAYRDGYCAEGLLTLFGRHVYQKAHRCGDIVLERVRQAGYELERTHVECIGGGDVVPGVISPTADWELKEGVMRICVADHRREAVECFAKELASLITCGAQGVTGYAAGRPKARKMVGFWPCLISSQHIQPKVEIIKVL